jgi:hypothetical protein
MHVAKSHWSENLPQGVPEKPPALKHPPCENTRGIGLSRLLFTFR